MPKPEKRRVGRSANDFLRQRDTAPAERAPGAAVTVSPHYAPVVPGESEFASLADSLKQFEPSLSRYVGAQQKEQNEADTQLGTAERMKQGDLPNEGALDHLKPHQTPAYQAAYMKMHGELSAQRRQRELEQAYATADRDTINIDEFVKKAVAEDTQGLNDKDYLAGYLPTMERFGAKLREVHGSYQTEKLQAATQSGWMERLMGSVDEIASNKKFGVDAFHETLQLQKKEGKDVFGLDYRRLDDMALEGVASVAKRLGRPDLLDVFKKSNEDGTPGLYFNPKYTDKVDKAAHAAKVEQDRQRAKEGELQEYNVLRYFEKQIDEGRYSEPEAKRHLKGPNGGVLTAQQVLALTHKADEVLKYKTAVAVAERAIRTRDTTGFALVASGDKGKQITQAAFDGWADEQLRTLPPQEAVKAIVDAGAPLRQFPSKWSYLLKSATPDDAKGFDSAAKLANGIYAVSPQFFYDILDNNQALARTYRVYDAEQRLAGKTPEQALLAARYIATPEAQERANSMLRARSENIESRVKEILDLPGFTDAKNGSYVRDSIRQLMVNNIAWGQTDWKDALKDAEAQFRSTHAVLNHRWVRTPTGLAQFESEALDTYVKSKTQEFQSSLLIGKDEGLYAMPVGGSWGLFRDSGDSLIAVIDLPTLIKREARRKADEAQDAQGAKQELRSNPEALTDIRETLSPAE